MTNSATPANSLLATIAHRATLALLAIALAAVAMLVRSWHDARATAAQLQSTLAAQQRTIAAATARESARDAQTAKTLAQIAAAKQRVKTPAQAAAALASALPPLPLPVDIELPTLSGAATDAARQSAPSPTPTDCVQHGTPSHAAERIGDTMRRCGAARIKLPDAVDAEPASSAVNAAPGVAALPGAAERTVKPAPGLTTLPHAAESAATVNPPNAAVPEATQPAALVPEATLHIPEADLKPLYDQLENCRACQASLSAAQSDLADERTKLTATAAERDAALKSAKGGAFWTRLKRGAKWFALGAATGATLAAAISQAQASEKNPLTSTASHMLYYVT